MCLACLPRYSDIYIVYWSQHIHVSTFVCVYILFSLYKHMRYSLFKYIYVLISLLMHLFCFPPLSLSLSLSLSLFSLSLYIYICLCKCVFSLFLYICICLPLCLQQDLDVSYIPHCGVRPHQKWCPKYDTKLYLMVRIQLWTSGEGIVSFCSYYSQVNPDLEWHFWRFYLDLFGS